MTRPRLLDLFCGSGGAAMGYSRAGFEVVGVDVVDQPHYPFEFHQADALEFLKWAHLNCGPGCRDGYDAIHASPPCQFRTTMSNRWRGKSTITDAHVDFLTPTLRILTRRRPFPIDVPWVVENVTGAADLMPNAILLRGAMFGLRVDRPRLFCSNQLLLMPMPTRRSVDAPVGVYGDRADGRLLYRRANGTEQRAAKSLEEAQKAMGMPWGDWHGVKEAIPPAYTEWIGTQLLAAVNVAS